MSTRTRTSKLFAGGGFVLVTITALCWIAAGRLASPPRRALESYHKEFLADPVGHGVVIAPSWCVGKTVPVLVVSPLAGGTPGSRGKVLREQVEDPPAFGEVRGLLVMLHGRHGRKEDLLAAAERFSAVGFICILPDLPAHGESPLETVQFGAGLGEAAIAFQVAEEVSAQRGLEDLPRFLWGMSMGGSFAVHALAESPDAWDAAVIVSSFDTLGGAVSDAYGGLGEWLKPVVALMTAFQGGADIDRLRPVDLAPEIRVPVLVVHGDADTLINIAHGKALFEAFGSPQKQWETVEGGTHEDVLITPKPLYATMVTWLLRWVPGDSH